MAQYSNSIAITFSGGLPLVGCGNGIRATSDPVDNSVTQFDKIDIEFKIKLGASGVLSTGSITIGIFGSDDGGVTYDTIFQPNTTLETITSGIANGNVIVTRVQLTQVPQFWKLGIRNDTGVAFNAVGANFASFYAGIINKSSITLSATQTNVTTSATLLASANNNRNGMLVVNKGGDTIYVGGSGVTISTGFPLDTDEVLDLDNLANNALYGIVPSVTSLASVLQW